MTLRSNGEGHRALRARDTAGGRAQIVLASIREAIREGALRPGQRLTERELAANLGVSRTPVRQALQLLEDRGMLRWQSSRGLVIAELDAKDVSQLYVIWAELEGLAAKLAAQYATSRDIDTLRRIHGQWKPRLEVRILGRLNRQFHEAIHRAANNAHLLRALAAIDDALVLLGATTFAVSGRAAAVGREHANIVQAIARGDQRRAESAARAHIRKAGRIRMSIMAEHE